MKRIRTYEKYRVINKREQIIKEAVLQVNDIYKVKTMIDIPQSLINKYVSKVKNDTGNDLRQFFGDVDIAEEIVKYINMNNLDIDKLPAGALMGGGEEEIQQGQPQAQPQMQPQVQPQAQPQAQPEGQTQMEEPQGQMQGEFEDPQAQTQVQVQTQGQGQSQGEEFDDSQAQVQVQTQGQSQGQSQGQNEEEFDENEEDFGDDDEELPL